MNKFNSNNLLKQCLTLALAGGLWGSAFAAQPTPSAAGQAAGGRNAVPAKAGTVNAKRNKPTISSTETEYKKLDSEPAILLQGGLTAEAPAKAAAPVAAPAAKAQK